ncbi:MAG: methyl-accepting chemotaxis protein [Bacillota bacterium]|nr:methyl-accepting chemotaxis protein [Bacillota bacterium]
MQTVERLARKINVRLRLILAFTLVVIVVAGVMGIYATNEMSEKIVNAAQQKLKSDLALGKQIIDERYPGEWSIVEGILYKGTVPMENNFKVIDDIGSLTGDTVTIFKGDTRVSTNVMKNGQRKTGTQVSKQVAQAVLSEGRTFIGRANVVGTWNETAYEPIYDASGKIIGIWYVGVPATPYDEMVVAFRLKMITTSAVGILFGFLAAFLIAFTVDKPLRRIQSAITSTSNGDLTVQIPTNGHDELSHLGQMTNNMVLKISELITISKNLTEKVRSSTSLLNERSDANVILINDIASKSQAMSDTTLAQAELTTQSKAAISEMSVAMQQMALNTQKINSSSTGASQKAQLGEKQIEQAIQQISIISETVNSTSDVIQHLGSRSQQIGKIVDLITNIADQTNLLALNAAIEAARAGEMGRGFAVVADEVRKLAEESGDAAKQIAGLIEEVQTEALRAVSSMDAGTREVSSGSEIIHNAGKAFEDIITAIDQVGQQIQEMSATTEEIASSGECALQAIDQTSAAAEQNSNDANHIREQIQLQLSGFREISASVDELTLAIDDLQRSIDFFKI